ncbi:hypothetical protein SAMN05216198_2588 [Halopseudomonas litoralis]|uniref:Uncharacterized protein n=1 Tax=Halopseudomonas litoralis TaxID=797277 RepID=A0A1H1UG63_9GAMM|nr:hypothetical protein [Halopseudomonas litoralis]SDS71428.1 hypothetical protein SAMN05216198_2588 [Halopseudomonas litoralis]
MSQRTNRSNMAFAMLRGTLTFPVVINVTALLLMMGFDLTRLTRHFPTELLLGEPDRVLAQSSKEPREAATP